MSRVFLQGLMVLVAGIVALILNQLLNLGLGSIVFGLAIGGIVGLVADGGPVGRALALVVGIIIAMIMYIVRVLFLNGSFAGNVVLITLGLVLVTVICALTSGRLPLWAALAGIALVTGAYETAFVDAPQNVTTELFQYSTMALVPAAFAFLATVFVADRFTPATPSDEGFGPDMAPPAPEPATVAAAPAPAPAAPTPPPVPPPPQAPPAPPTTGTNSEV